MQLKHVSQADGKTQGTAYNLISAAVCEIHAGLSGREEAALPSHARLPQMIQSSAFQSQNSTLVRNQNPYTRAIAYVK